MNFSQSQKTAGGGGGVEVRIKLFLSYLCKMQSDKTISIFSYSWWQNV